MGLLGPPGGLLGRSARIVASCSPSWAHFGAVLGPSWAVLGAFWAVLEPFWSFLVPSWGLLGQSWGRLGGLLGCLGTSEARKGDKPKNNRKPLEHQGFLPHGALLGGLVGLSWGIWKASWAVLERFSAVLGCLGTLLGRLGNLLGLSWAVPTSGAAEVPLPRARRGETKRPHWHAHCLVL